MGRTIFIGDVHGCYDELVELVEKKLRVVKGDRVILLGDLINKGPKSADCIRYALKMGFECIMGNHEMHFRDAPEHKNYDYLSLELTSEEKKWITKLPFYIEAPQWIAVHAGCLPDRSLKQTPEYILTQIRTWDGLGKNLRKITNPPWYTLADFPKPIFYGHWAVAGLMIRRNAAGKLLTIGLDSRCVYGGELSAWIFETSELVQVKAKKTYRSIRFKE